MTRNILLSYYAATVLFLLLDYVLGINIRIAFLDGNDSIKIAYYAFCLACFALMVWRPGWTVAIGAVESLITLVAIILHMALRVMGISHPTMQTAQGFVTMPELINFMIAGGIAYFAWSSGMKELFGDRRF